MCKKNLLQRVKTSKYWIICIYELSLFFREELERNQQKWLEELEKYEDKHKGNFRRIYPGPGTEKYDKFFNSSGSLFQETATYKARVECARYAA